MSILAQHGFGDAGRIEAGLQAGLIDGCILSPKDLTLKSLQTKIAEVRAASSAAKIYFDPQFYATIVANEPGARLGSLTSDYSPYFAPKHFRDLRREKHIKSEVEKVIRFQRGLGLSEIVLPGIMIQDGLKSESASIAKSFLEVSDEVAKEQGLSESCWLTLSLGESCFRDLKSLQDFVDEITGMMLEANGIYILVETSDLSGINPWCHSSVLSGQMYLVYALRMAGFNVVCGYGGLSTPYLSAAGADSVAVGWFNTLRHFSLDRFRAREGMSQRPKKKYLSRALWSQLDAALVRVLQGAHPTIMNGSSQDQEFVSGDPKDKDEILQYWHAVGSFSKDLAKHANIKLKIADLRLHLIRSEQLKASIPTLSIPMFDERISQTRGALRRFEDLAELSLSPED